MTQELYDVAVIGAGVSGCAVARELARYDARVCVIEKEEDVCSGTSKANSAIVHAGFDAQPGSLMAKLNVEGNRLMYEWAKELNYGVIPVGSLVVCVSEESRAGLDVLLERGRANGVPDLRIIERDELVAMEPNISDEAVAALYAPTGGIVDCFGLTIALAENATANGVEFLFEAPVSDVRLEGDVWEVTAGDAVVRARAVVNAAGVYADQIHNLVATPDDRLTIVARKGEYYLLDNTVGDYVRHTVFMLPTAMGKGVLVSPTVHGNLIVGPTATDVDDKEATDTTAEGLAEVVAKCSLTVKDVPLRESITNFAGLRAHQQAHDFVIGEVEGAPRFFDCAAIESPGLTSAPAIGQMLARQIGERLGLSEKPEGEFDPTRPGVVNLVIASFDEWAELCRRDPAYGNVVCRCCRVSEAQIVDVIRRNPAATSLDAIKRRTGAMMGRCQGGFCTPKIMEILERELGMDPRDIAKNAKGSELLVDEGRA
ncbi:MAG: NAD(P)/FAD-dependent oxidoreductase [Atopobiaceae bacterium]|nr:NAD(P)/FAD-dependent oxidoreductase [Atopobiaceae bacterium]